MRSFVCDQIEARQLEIAEKLHRSELTPDERDQHVLEWERFVAGVEKEVSRNDPRNPSGRMAQGRQQRVARGTGVDENTVRQAKKLDQLPLDVKEAADKAGLLERRSCASQTLRTRRSRCGTRSNRGGGAGHRSEIQTHVGRIEDNDPSLISLPRLCPLRRAVPIRRRPRRRRAPSL